jgi:hypothetical protein
MGVGEEATRSRRREAVTKVLIQCPCCNTVLQVEVTLLQVELVSSVDVDKESMKRGMEKLLKEMPEYSPVSNREVASTLRKWNPGQPGQYEEDIYHDYEIARLRKELDSCYCNGHDNGPCGDCQERMAVLSRLLAHKDQLTDKAKGLVACPHCKGAKTITYGTDWKTDTCPVCCGTGTVYQTTLRKVEKEGE